jgi:hypothetical protein
VASGVKGGFSYCAGRRLRSDNLAGDQIHIVVERVASRKIHEVPDHSVDQGLQPALAMRQDRFFEPYVVSAGNDYHEILGDDNTFDDSGNTIPAAYPEVATISAMAVRDYCPFDRSPLIAPRKSVIENH